MWPGGIGKAFCMGTTKLSPQADVCDKHARANNVSHGCAYLGKGVFDEVKTTASLAVGVTRGKRRPIGTHWGRPADRNMLANPNGATVTNFFPWVPRRMCEFAPCPRYESLSQGSYFGLRGQTWT